MKTNVPAPTIRTVGKKTEVGYTVAAIVCVLMNCGPAFAFSGVFPSSDTAPARVYLWGTAVSLLFLAAVRFRGRRWVLPAAAAAPAVLTVVFIRKLMDGAALLYNDVMDLLCVRTGRIFLRIASETDADAEAAVLFLAAVCAVLIVGAAVSRSLLPVLPLLAAAWGCAAAGVTEPGFGFAMLICGAALLYVSGTMGRRATPKAALAPFSAIVVLTALSLLAAGVLPFSAASSRDRMRSLVHTLRFSDRTAVMPEGALAEYTASASEAPALEVTLSLPQRMLLRGYIGEIYTGNGFSAVPGEDALKARTLFYLLHSDGFYGGAALGAAYGALGEAEGETLTVKPVGACRRYLYAPYAVLAEGQFDQYLIGDARLYASSGKARQMTYIPGQITDWMLLEARLTEQRNQPAAEAFLSDEGGYRTYVYAEYLQLTDEAEKTLSSLLAEEKEPETLGQALQLVTKTLDASFYKENADVAPGKDEDYITLALGKNAGNGVTRAAAAVLLLRYLGVPARYVEGYEITEEDALKMTPGQAYTLTEANARAWAEYYYDGLGWIPLEPLPGKSAKGDLPSGTNEDQSAPPEEETDAEPPEEEQTTNNVEPPAEQPPEESDPQDAEPTEEPDDVIAAQPTEPEKEPPEEDEDDGETRADSYAAVWRALLFVLLLLLLLLAAVVLRARRIANQRIKRIENAPLREALVREYAYILLLRREGAEVPEEDLIKAKRIAVEAYFSSHRFMPSQKDWMRGCRLAAIAAGEKTWSAPKRLWLRFVKGLY